MPNHILKFANTDFVLFANSDFVLFATGKRKAFTAPEGSTVKTGDLLTLRNTDKSGQYVQVEVTDVNEKIVSIQLPETYHYKK